MNSRKQKTTKTGSTITTQTDLAKKYGNHGDICIRMSAPQTVMEPEDWAVLAAMNAPRMMEFFPCEGDLCHLLGKGDDLTKIVQEMKWAAERAMNTLVNEHKLHKPIASHMPGDYDYSDYE